ncbi:hypothetical protein KP509_31G034400 [Ceratopteris richardii]|uniref:RING-type domain-containing protein n=1 Tax=Ceratopteris richardii TaxID=49495 RepID=A0A8T2QX23_CERRI|nr:hypothetical protein KP509_31G034400 [Ceratopteris richardii]
MEFSASPPGKEGLQRFHSGEEDEDGEDGSPSQTYSINGTIVISSLAVLFVVSLVLLFLRMYTKCTSRSATASVPASMSRSRSALSKGGGLHRQAIEAFPIFAYAPHELPKCASSDDSAATNPAAECAVCLSELCHGSVCKLLPGCGHFFHAECIDSWFLTRSTCPLCRAAACLQADDRTRPQHAEGVVVEQTPSGAASRQPPLAQETPSALG